MIFLPPFVIHGTHLATEKDIEQGAALYHNLLKNIAEDTMDYDNLSRMHYANEILPKPSNQR
jgi:glutathione-regulated potassium-efflux system ancillary protein KefG